MQAGQTVDVAAAWHEFGDRLRVYVARRVNSGDADDVVQSVMVKLLERRAEIDTASVRAWLFTVTRNAVAEYYRQRRPAIDLEGFGDIPETDDIDPADRTIGNLSDCLDPMLRMLSRSDADLLRRIDLHGEAQTGLAASLGIPLSTLKSRVQRARTKLRSAFDQCCSIDLGRNGAPIAFERRAACQLRAPTMESPLVAMLMLLPFPVIPSRDSAQGSGVSKMTLIVILSRRSTAKDLKLRRLRSFAHAHPPTSLRMTRGVCH